MDAQTRVYLDSLKRTLGVESLDEITEEHAEKLFKWFENNKNPEIQQQLMLELPHFLDFATQLIMSFNKTVDTLVQAGVQDVEALRSIIERLSILLEQPHLSGEDKRQIFHLLSEYSSILDNTIENNDRLRRYALAGAFITTAVLGGLVIYRLTDGRGERIAEITAQKMIEQGKL